MFDLYYWLIVLGIVLFIILVFLWSTYNQYVRRHNLLKNDFSDIEIQLKRRADLIEKIAAKVKEYAEHEKGSFTEVAKARAALDNSGSVKETAHAENMLNQSLRSIFAVVESHPQLKANDSYNELVKELKLTEDRIAEYRETYNDTTRRYNDAIQTFPNLISARIFGFTKAEYFSQAA